MWCVRGKVWWYQCIPDLHSTFLDIWQVCPKFPCFSGILSTNLEVFSSFCIHALSSTVLPSLGMSLWFSCYSPGFHCIGAMIFATDLTLSFFFSAEWLQLGPGGQWLPIGRIQRWYRVSFAMLSFSSKRSWCILEWAHVTGHQQSVKTVAPFDSASNSVWTPYRWVWRCWS